jgi:hypothetical protein
MDFIYFFWESTIIWICLYRLFIAWGGIRDINATVWDRSLFNDSLFDEPKVNKGEIISDSTILKVKNGHLKTNLSLKIINISSTTEKFSDKWQIRLETEMHSRKYSPKTHSVYIHFNRMLCHKIKKTPDEISQDDVKRFMAEMEKDGYSASTMNLAYSAIKFFSGMFCIRTA